MIDLHCHILPGIDDGPSTLDGSLELARAAVQAGTRTIAATPHIDHSFYLDPRGTPARVEELNRALRAAGIALDVVQGGEVALTRLPDLEQEDLYGAALGDSAWILLECPLSSVAPPMEPAVALLQREGYGVLLAHPERSPGVMRDVGTLQRMVAAGALAQVTAGALAGSFGQTVRRCALRLVREDLVHCVSSDAHDAFRRPPDLLGGIEAAAREIPGLEDRAEWYTEHVPRAILAGERPDPPPPLPLQPQGRGLLRRLRRA